MIKSNKRIRMEYWKYCPLCGEKLINQTLNNGAGRDIHENIIFYKQCPNNCISIKKIKKETIETEEDNYCIECKPEDQQESPMGGIFCLKCGKIINSKDIFYECLDCSTIYSEGECDESAFHCEENKLICANCCSYNLKKIK